MPSSDEWEMRSLNLRCKLNFTEPEERSCSCKLNFDPEEERISEAQELRSSSPEFFFRGGKWMLMCSYGWNYLRLSLYYHGASFMFSRAFPVSAHLEGAEDATGRTTNIDTSPQTETELLDVFPGHEMRHLLPNYPEVTVSVLLGEKKDCSRTGDDSSLDCLSEDMTNLLLEDNSDTDVFLLCGGCEFRAHKSILSARSPVFSRMLHSDMEEGRTGQVTVQDMTPESFRPFLRYLYTGKLTDLTVDSARNLLEAGDRFEVPALVKRCEEYLVRNLSEGNACEMLVLSDIHRAQTLKETAIARIISKKIPLKAEWPSFCHDHSLLAFEVLNQFFKQQNQFKIFSDTPFS